MIIDICFLTTIIRQHSYGKKISTVKDRLNTLQRFVSHSFFTLPQLAGETLEKSLDFLCLFAFFLFFYFFKPVKIDKIEKITLGPKYCLGRTKTLCEFQKLLQNSPSCI